MQALQRKEQESYFAITYPEVLINNPLPKKTSIKIKIAKKNISDSSLMLKEEICCDMATD